MSRQTAASGASFGWKRRAAHGLRCCIGLWSIRRGRQNRPTRATSLVAAIGDPHGGDPDDVAVFLLAADVVIARLAGLGGVVLPGEVDGRHIGFGRVDV